MEKGKLYLNENLSERLEYNSPTTNIKATYANHSDYPNGVVPAHWHKELECIITLTGSLTYHVNNHSYIVSAGNGLIVNTNRLHLCCPTTDNHNEHLDNIIIDETNDALYAVLIFNPDTLRFNHKMEEKYINPLLFDNSNDVFTLQQDTPWQKELIDIILEVFHAVMDKTPYYELFAQGKFFELWRILFENTIAKTGYELADTDPMSPLKTMISYMQNNYQEKITLSDVAEAGMMCQSKCCRLFRDALKQSPIEYLQNYRIGKGLYLLDHTDMSITEIALECGFHGASYFTETFRKINGMTPKEYRKQEKSN